MQPARSSSGSCGLDAPLTRGDSIADDEPDLDWFNRPRNPDEPAPDWSDQSPVWQAPEIQMDDVLVLESF